MGFYYLILLVLGIILLIVGIKKAVTSSIKKGMIPFVIGLLFTVMSIMLLQPGSSDLISKFLIKIAN